MSAAILGYGLASILADINLTWPVSLKWQKYENIHMTGTMTNPMNGA